MTANQLWSRWTLANALSELLGLGLTFVITGLFFASLGEQNTTASLLLSFVVAVLSGAIEATFVGLAQWWAMHPWFSSIERFAWWRGTLIGALIAYILGYLPSTLMSLGEATASTAPIAEPAPWVVLLLAAGMGAVGGAVLSFAQWLVLRGKVQRAGLWIPANMLAWLFGMPIIFWGIDLAFEMSALWQSLLVMAGTLFVAGTVVGAIHGLFLIRLADHKNSITRDFLTGWGYNHLRGNKVMVKFRPMNLTTDAADMARLYNYTVPEPITVETACDWWTVRAGEIRVTTLAFDEKRQAVGYWDVDRETWMKPGHFYIKVIVQPEARGHGFGTLMYTDALRSADENGATHLKSSVRDTDISSLKFAVKRGFKIEHHTFESTLDFTNFNEHRFDDLMARLHADGFRFFSLAEAGLTDENKHKLYEVNRAAAMDNPGNDGVFPDFYAFSKNVFEASWFRADTQIIASLADQWVGLAAIGIYPADNHAYNTFTGVLREYRGRGLALALKLQTILLAKREGVRYTRTHNDSKNRSMLAVNRKLGYKPEPGNYELLCVLAETRGTGAESA